MISWKSAISAHRGQISNICSPRANQQPGTISGRYQKRERKKSKIILFRYFYTYIYIYIYICNIYVKLFYDFCFVFWLRLTLLFLVLRKLSKAKYWHISVFIFFGKVCEWKILNKDYNYYYIYIHIYISLYSKIFLLRCIISSFDHVRQKIIYCFALHISQILREAVSM